MQATNGRIHVKSFSWLYTMQLRIKNGKIFTNQVFKKKWKFFKEKLEIKLKQILHMLKIHTNAYKTRRNNFRSFKNISFIPNSSYVLSC